MNKKLNKEQVQSISDLGRRFSDATILMHEAIAKKAGLSGTDHKYLGLLIQKGAMTAGELSKETGLTTGAVTGLIDRLERKKLAKREFDKDDRRKVIVIPDLKNTTKLLGETFEDLTAKTVNLVSDLSEKEMVIIEKYLISTIEVLNEFTNNLSNPKKTMIF